MVLKLSVVNRKWWERELAASCPELLLTDGSVAKVDRSLYEECGSDRELTGSVAEVDGS